MSRNSGCLKDGYGLVTHLESGETWKITNIRAFCREVGINQQHLSEVSKGKRKQHKGYTLEWHQ